MADWLSPARSAHSIVAQEDDDSLPRSSIVSNYGVGVRQTLFAIQWMMITPVSRPGAFAQAMGYVCVTAAALRFPPRARSPAAQERRHPRALVALYVGMYARIDINRGGRLLARVCSACRVIANLCPLTTARAGSYLGR